MSQSLPRVFVLSMPRAGTYLLGELLARAGIAPTQIHVADDSYDDYSRLGLAGGRAIRNVHDGRRRRSR